MADQALTKQMLEWISQRPRTYAETMDAWRTSCPRLSIWEDALADGLVEVLHGTDQKTALVRLTAAGENIARG